MALHFILDGYNIVKNFDKLADLKLEDGRNGLIKSINRYRPQGSLKNSVTIVFDGQSGWADGLEQHNGIRVIFSSCQCADEKIKELVDQTRSVKSCVVVTNDREIRYYVRAAGAQIMSVEEFTARLKPDCGPLKTVLSLDDKPISKLTELEINRELQGIWLKRKRAS